MKKLFSIFIFSMMIFSLSAQKFEVPENYSFKQDADYVKYQSDVLKGIDWLMQTPINTQPEKRKDVNTFIVTWLEGSPTVTVEINEKIVNFMQPNPDLLMIFMCGWIRYSLEYKDYTNKTKGYQKGIEAVIDFYVKNKENLKEDKNVEKYIQLKDDGKLEDFITKNV